MNPRTQYLLMGFAAGLIAFYLFQQYGQSKGGQ